ncbi:MAG: hypothetical protein JJ992_25815 [Planctomycetes bacterium]|nr:hypothetical protein [Planctomycetota bacterium]
MFPIPQVARSQSGAPGPFSVSETARPIWSPTRPERKADVAQDADVTSSTLRLVRDGWGQSRVEPSSTATSNVLRWRSRNVPEAEQTAGFSIPLQPANWQENIETSESGVRTVAHEESADPFHDPFGDRIAQNRNSRYQQEPTDAAPSGAPPAADNSVDPAPSASGLPSLDELLPPYQDGAEAQPAGPMDESELPSLDDLRSPSSEQPAPPTELETPAAPTQPKQSKPKQPAPVDLAPAVPETPARQPRSKPDASGRSDTEPQIKPKRSEGAAPPLAAPAPSVDSPSTLGDGGSETEDCKRVYNDRDCCREDEKCGAARLALKQNSIKNISLDITASFKPDAASAVEESEAEQNQLRKMPSRVWRDRRGQILAEGRVVDVHNRRIVVQQEDGSTKTIMLGLLGEDETCFLAAWWQVPTECVLGLEHFEPRSWQPVTFTWKASSLCHKPLYFEERQLERYGHTTGPLVQPVLSGAHFFLNVAMLPYKMGINPPNECQYPLGYYRPGSCSPWLLPPAPISLRGGLFEAGAVTGVAFLFP